MLSTRTTLLFDLLGCNNSDIARCLDYSPSNISRIRSGNRTYQPQSRPILQLANGIYTFADSSNLLPVICEVCEVKDDNREIVIPALIAWLFDTDRKSLPKIPHAAAKEKKTGQERICRLFGEKLNDIMILLDMSNIWLAHQVNVDASLISRFRNGTRSPHSNTDLSKLIINSILNRASEQNKLSALSELTAIPSDLLNDKTDAAPAISTWLFNTSVEPDASNIDLLLASIDQFHAEKDTPLPEISGFATEEILNSNKTDYWGIDGLREAIIRFLGNAAALGGELYLYSDEDMAWMVGDKLFLARWYALMLTCVKHGVKIRIIHNIDRGADEMISAIKSWLPLYMSGMIESYVCRRGRNTRFSHTIFLHTTSACIYASHIKGAEANDWYEYLTDSQKLSAVYSNFNELLTQSESLIKIFVGNNNHIFEQTGTGDHLLSMLNSLSLGTMPESLLNTILRRNHISGTDAERITKFCAVQRDTFQAALTTGNILEFAPLCSESTINANQTRLNISSTLCNIDIFYTPEEYKQHIRAIADLIEENTSYHFYIMPELPFSDIQILHYDNLVTVIRSKKPYAAFIFSDSMLLQAFEDYFKVLEKHYSRDRSEIKARLRNFLSD